MCKATCLMVFLLALTAPSSALAAIAASGSSSNDETTTTHNGNRETGFTVVESVSYDANAGQWHKRFVNVGVDEGGGGINNISSGTSVPIVEIFTNVGSQKWTDWHEEILTTTDIGGGNDDYPGFLFRNGSLSVSRNGGQLTEGTDYSLVVEPYFNQVSPDGDWRSISIFFEPGAAIQPGDTLGISKDIFEVFFDGNIWMVGEAAVVAQYPTVPEPASFALTILGGLALALIWARRRN